jgi:hypothetical protein
MGIRGKDRTEETFGVDVKNPTVTGGTFEAVGHTIKDGQPIPQRGSAGTSPNVKTGFPANHKI